MVIYLVWNITLLRAASRASGSGRNLSLSSSLEFLQDPNTPLVLRSVWDWREQFNDKDISLFYNPLFVSRSSGDKRNMENYGTITKPLYAVSSLELWTQCYFRWIPTLEIRNGGQRHVELYIRLLQNDVNQLGINENHVSSIDKVGICSFHTTIDSFYPFSNNTTPGNTVSAPIMNSSILLSESLLDAQSLITATDWQAAAAVFKAFKTRTWLRTPSPSFYLLKRVGEM